MQKKITTTKKVTIFRKMMLDKRFQLSMAKGMIHFMEKTGQLKSKTSDEEIEAEFKASQNKKK